MRRSTPVLVIALIAFLGTTALAAKPRTALNTMLPDLNFTGVSLGEALDFLRDVTGTNVHINWQALEAVGVGRDTTLNLRMRNIPMRKVLKLVLSEAGSDDLLAYYVDGDVIEITTRELADRDLVTRIYPVDDLIMDVPDFEGPDMNLQGTSAGGSGNTGVFSGNTNNQQQQNNMTRAERAQALIDMIQAIIQPDIWQENGGTAAIRFFNGSLIVTAPRSVHEALGGYTD
jgi:hypothetical protein